ncbi:MAG: ion transporter [Muribaculaceae bacterium]|nr:ion transporter [Muribaculaceae bacterium]
MKTSDFQNKLSAIVDADHGKSRFSRMYDICMCIVIVLSMTPLMIHKNVNILNVITFITGSVFILDFLVRCYVSPIDKYKIGKPWWKRYPFSFMGLVDFLSILPMTGLIYHKLSLLKLFRFARIVALAKFCRYTDRDDMLLRAIKTNIPMLKTISFIVILYIFISALLIYNVEPEVNPVSGEVMYGSFFDALYWSIVTLTTVGYGDIYPVTFLGKIISTFSMIFGIGIFATVSSVVTAGFIEEIHKNQTK